MRRRATCTVEQLSISPQRGFASAVPALDGPHGNELGDDGQWCKLEAQSRVLNRI
jgi:hypothetical protein